jgi:hypothetical protein
MTFDSASDLFIPVNLIVWTIVMFLAIVYAIKGTYHRKWYRDEAFYIRIVTALVGVFFVSVYLPMLTTGWNMPKETLRLGLFLTALTFILYLLRALTLEGIIDGFFRKIFSHKE